MKLKEKKKRNESLNEKRKEILDAFQDDSVDDSQILEEIKKVEKEIVRSSVLKSKKRIDGRGVR